MTSELRPGEVLSDIAVFPLPGVVLFPALALPLHIFEPRYRAMTEDVLEAGGLLSVVKIEDGGRTEADGRPRICTVAGVGEIVEHRRYPDGRFDLLVMGRARVRLHENDFEPPYRRARAIVLESYSKGALDREVSTLIDAATRFAVTLQRGGFAKEVPLPETNDPERLADECAHRLIIDAEERQKVLETLDVATRIRACATALVTQCALLGSKQPLS